MHKRVHPIATPSHLAGRLIPLLTLLAATPFACLTAQASVVAPITYTWTGQGEDDGLYTPGNWQDDNAPPSAAWANNQDIANIGLLFGNAGHTTITDSDLYASQLVFNAITEPYYLGGCDYTNHIGSGGIIYSPAGDIRTEIQGLVQLHASQTWEINSGSVAIRGSISDSDDESSLHYQIEKTGAGTLALESSDNSYWDGGLKLTAGRVVFSYDPEYGQSSLGTGPIIFNGGTLRSRAVYYYYSEYYSEGDYNNDGDAYLTNDIISHGLVSLENEAPLHITSGETGNNLFRLDADTTLAVKGGALHVERPITESGGSRSLTLQSDTAVVLYGDSGWTGDTNIESGALIFAGDDNTPGKPGGITISSHGYAGIGSGNSTATFLSRINQADSRGTIGFDSDPDNATNTFTDPIDLTGFHGDVRLGSATSAIIGSLQDSTSLITPQGADYRFGGGGGFLQVATPLTDQTSPISAPRNLVVDSPAESPLTVLLLNSANTVSGNVIVNDSALIFGEGVPLPGTTGNFTMNSGGYIGTLHDPDAAGSEIPIATYLAHFASDTSGIIGFDNNPAATTTREIDFTGVTMPVSSNPVYLGTASALVDDYGDFAGPAVRFTGAISAPADGVHRFAAYKGGALEVSGMLTGDAAVIGSPDSQGSFGDVMREEYSTVALTGNNAGHLADGVTLYSGHLRVGQADTDGIVGTDGTHALGEGTLFVQPHNFSLPGEEDNETHPVLTADQDDMIIPNAIVLNNGLDIAGPNSFALSGNISGPGELYLSDESFGDYTEGSNQLTLSGDNTFAGGVYVGYGTSLTLASDTATGTGPLGFGYSGGYVEFTSPNPVVGGLWSDGSYSYINLNQNVQTLTINQQEPGTFYGYIQGDNAWTLIKSGAETLRLDSTQIITDGKPDGQGNNIGLDIRQGTVIFANQTSLVDHSYNNSPAIRISGGTFAVDGYSYVSNPIVVAGGGRLAGFGTYGGSVSIGAGAMLSPGLAGDRAIGTMAFAHLELNSGGIYEFSLLDPNPANPLGQDRIHVTSPTTLVINSTPADPFNIEVISLDPSGNPGSLADFDPSQAYSWTLINYDTLQLPQGADISTLFTVDHTNFLNSLAFDARGDGSFGVSLNTTSNQLMLNFTPVPEPSTYALLGLGLGIIGWSVWRRRRAAPGARAAGPQD